MVGGFDRGFLRLFVVGVLLSLLVAACGSGDDIAEPDDPQDGTETADEPEGSDDGDGTEGAEPRTLVVATPDSFLSHDPPVGGNFVTSAINWNMYDAPYTFTFEEQTIDGVPVLVQHGTQAAPALAERVEVADDGMTYTFHLRRGVQFYPSGNEMTAEDWLYSFERVLEMEVGFGRVFATLASITEPGRVVDDYTYELVLDKDNPIAEMLMATVDIVILDSEEARSHATAEDPWSHEWVSENSIGAGPYYLAARSEAEVVLEANPLYWGDAPYFERVIYRRVPDGADRELLLRRGDVDVAERMLQDQLDDLAGADGVQVVSAPSHLLSLMHMNLTLEPTDDPDLRQAILHAVPYDEIIERAYRGRAEKFASMFPPSSLGYVPGQTPEQDLDAARDSLARSNHPDGATLRMAVRNDAPEAEVEALLIRDALSQIGLDVEIEVLDVGAYFGTAAEYPLLLRTTQYWIADPLWAIGFHMLPDSVSNWSRIQIDGMAELQQEATTKDEEVREAVNREIQELWHEQRGIAYLAKVNQSWAMRDDIRNFVIHEAVTPMWALVEAER